MKQSATLSFERKGNLTHLVTLLQQHFLAQGYKILRATEQQIVVERGTIWADWFTSSNPINWKIAITVTITSANNLHQFHVSLKRCTVFDKNRFEAIELYGDAEINSVKRVVLSEEIIQRENEYIGNTAASAEKRKTINMLFYSFYGLYSAALLIFMPIVLIEFVRNCFKIHLQDLPIILFFLILQIYHFRKMYLKLVLYSLPMIVVECMRQLKPDNALWNYTEPFIFIIALMVSMFLMLKYILGILSSENFELPKFKQFPFLYKTIRYWTYYEAKLTNITAQSFHIHKEYRYGKTTWDTFTEDPTSVEDLLTTTTYNQIIEWNSVEHTVFDTTTDTWLLSLVNGKQIEVSKQYENWLTWSETIR